MVNGLKVKEAKERHEIECVEEKLNNHLSVINTIVMWE